MNEADEFDITQYEHTLDPADFSGQTARALYSLRSGDWSGFNLANMNNAMMGLYDRHGRFASRSKDGVQDPRCIEIRKCIHILSRIWARKWLERGVDIFYDKLNYYYRKARFERSNAHDELLYTALTKVSEDYETRLLSEQRAVFLRLLLARRFRATGDKIREKPARISIAAECRAERMARKAD